MDGHSYIKICLTAILLSISVGIFLSHLNGDLWPSIHLGVILSLVVCLLLIDTRSQFNPLALLIPVIMGVFLRVYTFLYPASMIGFDPDVYAIQIQGIIESGSIGAVQGSFYSSAPLFHIFAAKLGVISALPSTDALLIYPLLVGITFPLVTFLLIQKFLTGVLGSWTGYAGGIVAAVATMSVNLSYQPIAETPAALIWVFAIYIIILYLDTGDKEFIQCLLILTVAMIYTHKLPPGALVVSMIILILLLFGLKVLYRDSPFKMNESLRSSVHLIGIAVVMLSLQYFYISGLGESLLFRLIQYLEPGVKSALYMADFVASDAVPLRRTIQDRIIRNLHGLVLIPIACLSWFMIARDVIRSRSYTPSVIVMLAGALATALLMFITLLGPVIGGGVGRSLLIAEPLLIAVICIALYRRFQFFRVLVLFIIVAQLTSGLTATPDYGVDSRLYLIESEVAGKDYALDYAEEPIYTDLYYASETTPRRIDSSRYISVQKQNKIRGFDDTLFLNGTLPWTEYESILFRNKSVYRTGLGWYRIKWNPESDLNTRYNRVYDNSGSQLFVA